MEQVWSPGRMVTAKMSGSEVFVSESEFRQGWGLPAKKECEGGELVPLLPLVEEVGRSLHPRVSSAFEVFRGVARAAARVHPAVQPFVYASVKDTIRSSSKTTRMVRVMELQSLLSAYSAARLVVLSKAKRYFFSRFGKKKITELEVAEIEAIIKQITEELAR